MMTIDSLWIILVGVLVTGACSLLGCFLVLRRLSMVGDAISHAILPGVVLAFILTGSRASLTMVLGALAVGALTTFLIEYLSQNGVQGDAGMGVIFTALFALGVLLVAVYGRHVDLDLDCVLYGEIAYAPFDTLWIGERDLGPRPVWINGGLFVLNLTMVLLFYKELKLCAFDPGVAAAVGIPVTLMHYLLMGLVAVTTVGAFESVGVILVVAMLIAPAATAYLLTDRLSIMLVLSVIDGALSSIIGYLFAFSLDCSIAGAMGVVAGLLFAAALLFSPRHGVLSRTFHQWLLRRRVADEDVLMWVGRRLETGLGATFSVAELSEARMWPRPDAETVARRLLRAGALRREGDGFALTDLGQNRWMQYIRRHRLYETYLDDLGYAKDHQHDPTDRVEHHITPEMADAIEEATRHPSQDPHGRPIP